VLGWSQLENGSSAAEEAVSIMSSANAENAAVGHPRAGRAKVLGDQLSLMQERVCRGERVNGGKASGVVEREADAGPFAGLVERTKRERDTTRQQRLIDAKRIWSAGGLRVLMLRGSATLWSRWLARSGLIHGGGQGPRREVEQVRRGIQGTGSRGTCEAPSLQTCRS
jgi:hypothetical protein